MPLKRFQERVRDEVRAYLEALASAQAEGKDVPARFAWEQLQKSSPLGEYHRHTNGLGHDLPNFCIKVPTGGGKTVLATQVLGLIYQTILKERRGAGLVLWVVPSDQIYKDTLKHLRDRHDFLRESLEFALGGRIEVWEKNEIHRLTRVQLNSCLNILMLKLASTNRETREQLKFFRDSGGNIVLHFPRESDSEAHRALKERIPNLEMLVEDEERGEYLCKTSIGNLVRLQQPPVILDEGHKATSELARRTIREFNASIVVELSATPQTDANVLCRVSGKELLEEEMIKLPINIANSNQKAWKACLSQARDKRRELEEHATAHHRKGGSMIRPIVLVQVERTGRDQRGTGFVHSEDVKEHLMQRLDVPEAAIKIKSAARDDIEGIDLLADGCPVEWIITKSALQEGWDCPFAYILVSLNNTRSQQSMTQLVGRVLRQPFTERTDFQALNESYVYCLQRKAAEIASQVKAALEKEGYEGDAASVVDRSDDEGRPTPERVARIREEYKALYKEFEGKIYLPRFCVKQNGTSEALDYYRHLLSQVNVEAFDYGSILSWDLSSELNKAKDQFYRMTIGEEIESVGEEQGIALEGDHQVAAWLVASLQLDHFSQKQLRRVVARAFDKILETNRDLKGQLALVKSDLRERIRGFIEQQTDLMTKAAFDALYRQRRLQFFLECRRGRFEIPAKVRIKKPRLVDEQHNALERTLFDFVENDLNEYEKSVALFLDDRPEVLWWYRNLVGPDQFSIQGYRRGRIYPDFIIQQARGERPSASVLVVESKGKHLKGNEDSKYKGEIAEYFSMVGRRVKWQKLAEEFSDNRFRFQVLDQGDYGEHEWRDVLVRELASKDYKTQEE